MRLVIIMALLIPGCALQPIKSNIQACGEMCHTKRVEVYKDDYMQCKCMNPDERDDQ